MPGPCQGRARAELRLPSRLSAPLGSECCSRRCHRQTRCCPSRCAGAVPVLCPVLYQRHAGFVPVQFQFCVSSVPTRGGERRAAAGFPCGSAGRDRLRRERWAGFALSTLVAAMRVNPLRIRCTGHSFPLCTGCTGYTGQLTPVCSVYWEHWSGLTLCIPDILGRINPLRVGCSGEG